MSDPRSAPQGEDARAERLLEWAKEAQALSRETGRDFYDTFAQVVEREALEKAAKLARECKCEHCQGVAVCIEREAQR